MPTLLLNPPHAPTLGLAEKANVICFELNDATLPRANQWGYQGTSEALQLHTAQHFAKAVVISTLNESDLSEAVLAQLPNLKAIVSRSTGFDHIPLDYCATRGIATYTLPAYGQETVAEHAWMLLLGVSHQLKTAHQRVTEHRFSPKTETGTDVWGKTLGVIGAGRIGQKMIQMAQGFNMTCLANDMTPDPVASKKLGFTYVDLPTLLSQSDVISLHVPGGPDTHHLIDVAELAQMKPTSILINTARGSVVNTIAMNKALKEGRIRGLGLDTLEGEAFLRDTMQWQHIINSPTHPKYALMHANEQLMAHPQVFITPHCAYNTTEALERIWQMSIDIIEEFFK